MKKKGAYVDGYVLVVPKKKLPAYRRMAVMGEKIWRKYGVLDYKECMGDDLYPANGLPFPKLLKLKPTETVIFSFIVFRSRANRDRINALVMKDPVMNDPKYKDKLMPFDINRMTYAGFNVIVGA